MRSLGHNQLGGLAIIFLSVLLLCVVQLEAATVRINEVMSSNGVTIPDEDGDFEDWIELFNYGAAAVGLGGWGLSDD